MRDVHGVGAEWPHGRTIARHGIHPTPAISFTHPGEASILVEPPHVVHHIHPGRVALDENRLHRAGARVAEQHVDLVLPPVHPLDEQLARVPALPNPCSRDTGCAGRHRSRATSSRRRSPRQRQCGRRSSSCRLSGTAPDSRTSRANPCHRSRLKSFTPLASSCQYAIDLPSGLQRKPSRRLSSSSYTQSNVPLMIVRDPSRVRRVIAPPATSST